MWKSLKALPELLFPKSCLGCAKLGSELCATCAQLIRRPALLSTKSGVTIFAGFHFSALGSTLILAAKEDNNLAAREILAEAVNRALDFAIARNRINQRSKRIVLIPIPSRNGANRSRGFLHTLALANSALSQRPKEKLPEILILNCLEHSRNVRDQSKLSVEERARNMSGSIIVKRVMNLEQLSESAIFLVDDLVTTGATVSSAQMALKARGIEPLGAISSCSS